MEVKATVRPEDVWFCFFKYVLAAYRQGSPWTDERKDFHVEVYLIFCRDSQLCLVTASAYGVSVVDKTRESDGRRTVIVGFVASNIRDIGLIQYESGMR